MPDIAIVDTHVHLWDPSRLSYAWIAGDPLLDRAFLPEDYRRACGSVAVEAMVFLECFADVDRTGGQYVEELRFALEQASAEPRMKGIVPMAPLERGDAVRPMLEAMVAMSPLVKGVRRIVQFEDDPRALLLSPAFIEGVRALGPLGLHFEITADHTQMDAVLDFVARVPDVPMILDHCGKPGIRGGHIETFRRHIGELARHPNIVCKLSGLTVEADHAHWTPADLKPYVEAAIEAFGPQRLLYGGDWPVCLKATTLERWVDALDGAMAGLPAADIAAIYRDNANRFYRLGL